MRVEKVHPYTPSDFEAPDTFQTSAIGERLIKKLRQTQSNKLAELVRSLSKYERKFLSAVAVHDEDDVRRKAVRCLYIAPELARAQHLWSSGTRYFTSESADWAFRLLNNDKTLAEQLRPGQRRIAEAFVESREAAVETVWTIGEEFEHNAEDLRDHLRIVEGAALATALDTFLLTRANRAVWDLQSPSYLQATYKQMMKETQVKALVNARRLYAEDTDKWRLPDDRALALIEQLQTQERVQHLLERDEPETWAWCRQVLRYIRLSHFFTEVDDNERFEFWQEYLPKMADVSVDAENLRLFLDFGNFGILEFGEVGNASYVYPEAVFRDYLDKNERYLHRNSNNNVLKDQTKAIARLRHYRGWQGKFRSKLNNLFARHDV